MTRAATSRKQKRGSNGFDRRVECSAQVNQGIGVHGRRLLCLRWSVSIVADLEGGAHAA